MSATVTPLARVRRWSDRDLHVSVLDRVVIVLQCPAACGRYHHPIVDLTVPDAPVVDHLPDVCYCGELLRTPDILWDCLGTARNFVDATRRKA